MAAEATAGMSAVSASSMQRQQQPLVDHASGSIGAACCCCCRRCSCGRFLHGHGGLGLGLGLGLGFSRTGECSRLAVTQAHCSEETTAYASWVLFTASVALFFARAGLVNGVQQQAYNGPVSNRGRYQMHSFYNRRSYYQGRKDAKKARKSRWEWRPVTRRSAGSQTTPAEFCSVGIDASLVSSTTLVDEPQLVELAETPCQVKDSVVKPGSTDGPSFDDFPSLSRTIKIPDEAGTGEELKDLVAVGLELAPLPMVALLRTDMDTKECSSSTSKSHEPSASSNGESSAVEVLDDDPKLDSPEEDENSFMQTLNRKQRKHLRKKKKKLVAASHTIKISSLPILKSWKSSSSSSQPLTSALSSSTPWKIYDCSKAFGPLGSPSAKTITWTVSSKPPSYLSNKTVDVNSVAHMESKEEHSSASDQRASSDLFTVKPIWTLNGRSVVPEERGSKTIHEISEISESPKSYLGEWMDDGESFRRSQSDPEEIEMDAPHCDFEFEADSEDYSFQA